MGSWNEVFLRPTSRRPADYVNHCSPASDFQSHWQVTKQSSFSEALRVHACTTGSATVCMAAIRPLQCLSVMSYPAGPIHYAELLISYHFHFRRSRLRVDAVDAFVLGFEHVLWDPSAQQLYDGVPEALASTDMPFYILSRTAPAQVSAVLKERAGVDIPADSPRLLHATSAETELASIKQVRAH